MKNDNSFIAHCLEASGVVSGVVGMLYLAKIVVTGVTAGAVASAALGTLAAAAGGFAIGAVSYLGLYLMTRPASSRRNGPPRGMDGP